MKSAKYTLQAKPWATHPRIPWKMGGGRPRDEGGFQLLLTAHLDKNAHSGSIKG